MTAAEAAAQLAAAKSNTSGVFSLDQLKALGQTGDMATDWTKSAAPGGLIAGGGNAVLTAKGLKAGYYQLPGASGAEYFDPASGQASAEFVKWANSLTPADYNYDTGMPKGYIPMDGGPAASLAAQQPSKQTLDNLQSIMSAGGGQDAQDRVLGLGKYQQFLTDKNGKQMRISDIPSSPSSTPGFQDVSTFREQSNGGIRLAPVSFWQEASSGVSANTQHNEEAYFGLQQERIIAAAIAAGKDPGTALANALAGRGDMAATNEIANTGISDAQTKQIYDTYNSIQNPEEKAAYIRAQDPGNLTADLRSARDAARQGEANWMLKNKMSPTVTYESPVGYGGKETDKGQVKTVYGDVTQTDSKTGRSVMFGNVPISRTYVAPKETGYVSVFGHHILSGKDTARISGGIQGFMAGLVLGNPAMAVVGAYTGAGGPLPNSRNISLKNWSGWSDWKAGDPQQLSGMELITMVAANVLTSGIGSFASKYGLSPSMAERSATGSYYFGSPVESFTRKFFGTAFLGGSELTSVARGRQKLQDMNRARQRTGG